MKYQHADLTERVIAAFYTVYNSLGYGFLEKVYENALAVEIRKAGYRVEQQYLIKVYYDGRVVGDGNGQQHFEQTKGHRCCHSEERSDEESPVSWQKSAFQGIIGDSSLRSE